MKQNNLYHILEIPDYSDADRVKGAFRRLALKYHPDRNPLPEAAETFKILVNAYEILGNPALKQAYDTRLRSGFTAAFPIQSTPRESALEAKMRWYAKVKKERDALEEIENINRYESSLNTFPLRWRYTLIALIGLTGILSILSDWYKNGSRIALGLFLFMAAILWLWNEVYKFYWHRDITGGEKKPGGKSYDTRAYRLILRFLTVGLLLTAVLIKGKKIWHLHFFGEVIEASMDMGSQRIYYQYKRKYYESEVIFIPEKYRNQSAVYIRISNQEPEIWEFRE